MSVTTEAAPADVITEPGAYPALSEVDYHRQRHALSASGAKRLLPPSCPALFRWYADHPERKSEFDLGHAAHLMVLGVGAPLRVVDAEDWRTKKAKEERDAAYEAGEVPLLVKDWQRVTDMAVALREHPLAGALFEPGSGTAEQSLFWTDPESGVPLRARLDWIRSAGSRTLIGDYKSTPDASPDACSRWMHNFRYHAQGAWYTDGVRALDLGDDDTAFLLVFQERTPPYLITVVEPDPIALDAGRAFNRRAIEVFAECSAADTWPGYTDDVLSLSLPPWAERRYFEEYA